MERRARTGEIKKRQYDQGVKNKDMALEYGCSEQVVGQVIMGKKTSRPLQAFIERRLGARVGELFPRRDAVQAA